jgi:lipopolysaccharide export system protein LptA
MKTPLWHLALCVLCVGSGTWAHAEPADGRKPVNIEADALRYDDLKQLSVFTGNVVLTRGTLVVRGARVEVQQDPQGEQNGVITAESGKRAYFRQRRETGDEVVEGESEIVEFSSKTDVIKLIKSAELRRLRNDRVADVVSGNLIQYNSLTDVFSVDGGEQKSGGGRVRATLTPRGDANATPTPGTAGSSSTPRTPVPMPLRSEGALGGTRP